MGNDGFALMCERSPTPLTRGDGLAYRIFRTSRPTIVKASSPVMTGASINATVRDSLTYLGIGFLAKPTTTGSAAMKEEVREFKRNRILSIATELFQERGFQGVSIDALAEKLNVTKPFIYTYFQNKHALLEEMYERAIAALLQGIEEVFKTPAMPEDQLSRLVQFYVRQNVHNRALTSVFLNEERNLTPQALEKFRVAQRDFDQKLRALIQRGIDNGVFAVADATVAAMAIDGMVRWVHRWYQPDGRISVDELCIQMSDMALNLLGYQSSKGQLNHA
jgi:AcrR family transcriptional regulator